MGVEAEQGDDGDDVEVGDFGGQLVLLFHGDAQGAAREIPEVEGEQPRHLPHGDGSQGEVGPHAA